ncbi:MAG: response regulator transcription factor [Candidatus Aceula meridiana]|nr:response regulator transcription factor [Candidatus Aceula meridiana]
MPDKNILIVEDDRDILKLVRYNLEKAGFKCYSTITGEEALEILDAQPIDLVILDIMLPKMDGLETCKQIKQDKATAAIPIVMLTAKGEEVDRIVGFELGADDYIVKPFSPRELVLRVNAILKRGKPKEEPAKEIIGFKDLIIDKPRHKVMIKNKELKLTAMEFKLLEVLLLRKGRVQTREQLLESVWNIDSDITTRTVDTHIKRLRQKIGKYGKLIETVRGYGYRLNDEE